MALHGAEENAFDAMRAWGSTVRLGSVALAVPSSTEVVAGLGHAFPSDFPARLATLLGSVAPT